MKIAVCPGSFDPITNGHLAVIRRASRLFDKVIVVVMANFRKPVGLFSVDERVELIKRCTADIENVDVDFYGGLLADYAREKGAVAIVKGLRAVSDFEDEFQQALTNKQLNPEVETIFITAEAEHMYLSSSLVKQIGELGANIDMSKFVPPQIADDIVERLKGRNG
ncbi:MAG: pantetheine-phosphate adenylyltransferase [Oscillospiraceae bacterium]|jgi:pantetheine-phosphate adenylyltransferase|nr:pantetheine-phosphate adenylyltransferase [Ruminococcus sp.]MDD7337228.1 pantetheine-phosphate adenylyltransferase [Ruminococcus sp.]MDY6062124.1 pantetheine-phosphate adenylyltransferase [Oscillospiraceae bacterium]